jgi:SAM-dependent methyltransferase
MPDPNNMSHRDKIPELGAPSYVWRAGQERRLKMILNAAEDRVNGSILENGCGIGIYVEHLATHTRRVIGLEYEYPRAVEASYRLAGIGNVAILNAAGEKLPFSDGTFDLILSHEVLEHVKDDRQAVREMVRTLRIGGRAVIFVPNRGYPFETHGIYWRGNYHFGNIPLVNYLPNVIRNRLAPHVRVYSQGDLLNLFEGLNVRFVEQTVIFGAYDNIIARWKKFGNILRSVLQRLEKSPLRIAGLSHFWVVEKI